MTERLGPLSLCHTHSHLTSSLGALSSHSRPNPTSACPVAALTSHDGKMGCCSPGHLKDFRGTGHIRGH